MERVNEREESEMNTIILMVGNMGSGKSTYVKSLIECGYFAVSRDAIRYMFGAGKYIFNNKSELSTVRGASAIVRGLMLSEVDIVVDETHMNTCSRSGYIKLAQDNGYNIIACILPKVNREVSVERRMQNPHGQFDRNVWYGVWDKFNNMWEEPTLEEGFNEIREV